MASLQQKRPSISNWFTSLRRQPKNKKPSTASMYGSDANDQKRLQRSCIDISNSVFYMSPDLSSGKRKITGNIASTDNLNDEDSNDDRRVLVAESKSGVSKLCSRCCCSIEPDTRNNSPTPPTFLTISHNKIAAIPTPPRSPSLAPYSTVATYNLSDTSPVPSYHSIDPMSEAAETSFTKAAAAAAAAATATTRGKTNVAFTSETVTETDVSRDITVTRLPCVEQAQTVVLKKRSEFKRSMTTTTTTTHTMVRSRPVELILNEKGEIVARRPPALVKAARSSSLDCVLDNHVVIEDDDVSNSSASYSPCTPPPQPLDVLVPNDDELRFIDDSSTSHSETERNSDNSVSGNNSITVSNNHQRRLNDNEPDILRSTTTRRQQPNISNSFNNNNNNSNNNNYNNTAENNAKNNLCNACKNVIELNRTNDEQNTVIMRYDKQIKDELAEIVAEMKARDAPDDCKHSNKDKQMSIGRKKFNMDPKKGIEYLVQNHLLRYHPHEIAHFLYKGEGLNKTAIGDYLGERNDFHEDVLKAFVSLHDFTNLILVQALRQFLWSFRLPGEAQKIDRMMECFAQRYCQLNPNIFTNTDTCYVLSFAIIMLNTSLHNPAVKDKPTVEQFISMNRGINNGGDLPRGLLESLYESIKTEPFKIPQDDGNDLMHTFFNPDKEGWLWKQGGRYKTWKRRWFILNDNCLYYFEYTTDKEPRGIIPLENISVREIHDRSKPHCFELYATGGADIIKACKTDSEGKVVEGKHTVYRMSAATEEDQQEWIKCLTQSISHNPFYDILVQRKKKALSRS